MEPYESLIAGTRGTAEITGPDGLQTFAVKNWHATVPLPTSSWRNRISEMQRISGFVSKGAPNQVGITLQTVKQVSPPSFLCKIDGVECLTRVTLHIHPKPRRSAKWYERKARMRRLNKRGAKGY